MSEMDVIGPVDYLVLEFPTDRADGSMADALLDLVDQGIIRVYDLTVIQKHDDGSYSGIDLTDLSQGDLGGLTVFAGACSGLIGDDDLADAAEVLEPGTTAAILVFENAWAAPFVAAARNTGAEVVASGRIPADALLDALDALEAADA
jgi:uncharacterized membrane protein